MNSFVHKCLRDLPTPALLLDLDILESNLQFMQQRADALGVRLRPHLKTHKCLEIAELQRQYGARGITVSTIEEARTFARLGFSDILWAFPVIPSRIPDVLELSREIELGVTVDSGFAVGCLEDGGAHISVWLEVDCGYGRSGLAHDSPDLVSLAQRIDAAPNLRLRGCLTHAGHAYHAESPARIRELAESERRAMVETGERLRAAGIDPGSLSVGSTPTMSLVEDLDGIDEARPGNYALYDYTQMRLGACGLDRCAVTVLATVVSHQPGREESVADCGALVLSKDLGPDDPAHFGRVYAGVDLTELEPEVRVVSVSQEHAIVSAPYAPGTLIRVLPNHSCLTVAQFDGFEVVRGEEALGPWRIWRDRGLRASQIGSCRGSLSVWDARGLR